MKERTKRFIQACDCLTPQIKNILIHIKECEICEEIRLRAGKPIYAVWNDTEHKLGEYIVTQNNLQEILSRAARYSVHSYSEYIAQGFLPLDGGHRLGICGTAVINNGKISGIRTISSLNLRIAQEYIGCADSLMPHIFFKNGRPKNVLILSPPAHGKTTLLRDLIRQVSNKGIRISIADERGELAALNNGVAQFDIGIHTDVIEAPKAEAVLLLLKTMSPKIIALDEITSPNDLKAIDYAGNCGVGIFASAHAINIEDLKNRPLYSEMMKLNIFDIIISLEKHENTRKINILQGGI